MTIIRSLFRIGPLLFGLAFLAPLIAQSMQRLSYTAPFDLSPLVFGLIVGGLLGLLATVRGRWV